MVEGDVPLLRSKAQERQRLSGAENVIILYIPVLFSFKYLTTRNGGVLLQEMADIRPVPGRKICAAPDDPRD